MSRSTRMKVATVAVHPCSRSPSCRDGCNHYRAAFVIHLPGAVDRDGFGPRGIDRNNIDEDERAYNNVQEAAGGLNLAPVAQRNFHLAGLQIRSVKIRIALPEVRCLASIVAGNKRFLILPHTPDSKMILKVLSYTGGTIPSFSNMRDGGQTNDLPKKISEIFVCTEMDLNQLPKPSSSNDYGG